MRGEGDRCWSYAIQSKELTEPAAAVIIIWVIIASRGGWAGGTGET